MLDIIINFFVIRDSDVIKYDNPINELRVTADSYYNDGFWFDFIVWFPLDSFLVLVHSDFVILKIVKSLRLAILNQYMNNKMIKEICSKIFNYRFNSILKDPKESMDFRENRTMIETKIIFTNLVITLKIFFFTILALYFTGSYWLFFSLMSFTLEGSNFSICA